MSKIVSLKVAKQQGDTPAHVEQLAAWHAERSKAEFDYHDIMAFRFARLAAQLRVASPIAA